MCNVQYKVISCEHDHNFSFGFIAKHFAHDNCATHHVRNDKSLFVGNIKPVLNVGITGVGGTVSPVGIGNISFTIRDSENKDHLISFFHVIYLPSCP